jgi:hypothetical protein
MPQPEDRRQEATMNVFETLTNIFRKLFLDQRTGPTAGEPDEAPKRAGISSGGWETRCVNPDIGCPFEIS